MTDKQPEALKWADAVECAHMSQLAEFLRTQHAAMERKDTLLRQALKAMKAFDYEKRLAAIAAIKQELSK